MTGEMSSPEELARKLEDLRALVSEQQDQLLRARAELENQRKRAARSNEEARRLALQDFIGRLLPVKDNLERGLEAVTEDTTVDAEALRQGIRLTLRLWDELLTSSGVEQVDPTGQPFEPELHEALSMRDSPDVAPNTVVEVAQKGYLLNGRLIRPARVIVSAGGPDPGSTAE
jgi:molecular chaperone GrpE